MGAACGPGPDEAGDRWVGQGECEMCLAVPGQVVRIEEGPLGFPMGTVSFGGIDKEICFAYVPEAQVGDYVLVHVGFALNRIDEKEAQEVFEMLRQMGELADLQPTAPEGRDEAAG